MHERWFLFLQTTLQHSETNTTFSSFFLLGCQLEQFWECRTPILIGSLWNTENWNDPKLNHEENEGLRAQEKFCRPGEALKMLKIHKNSRYTLITNTPCCTVIRSTNEASTKKNIFAWHFISKERQNLHIVITATQIGCIFECGRSNLENPPHKVVRLSSVASTPIKKWIMKQFIHSDVIYSKKSSRWESRLILQAGSRMYSIMQSNKNLEDTRRDILPPNCSLIRSKTALDQSGWPKGYAFFSKSLYRALNSVCQKNTRKWQSYLNQFLWARQIERAFYIAQCSTTWLVNMNTHESLEFYKWKHQNQVTQNLNSLIQSVE